MHLHRGYHRPFPGEDAVSSRQPGAACHYTVVVTGHGQHRSAGAMVLGEKRVNKVSVTAFSFCTGRSEALRAESESMYYTRGDASNSH